MAWAGGLMPETFYFKHSRAGLNSGSATAQPGPCWPEPDWPAGGRSLFCPQIQETCFFVFLKTAKLGHKVQTALHVLKRLSQQRLLNL
jgi:hypothetical protein